MNPIYEEFREMAEGLLAEFGAPAVLLKPGEKTGPEHRPTIGLPIRKNITVFRTSKTITSPTDPRLTIVKDSYLISTVGRVRINDADQILVNGKVLTIGTVREISPAGLTILWVVTVGG